MKEQWPNADFKRSKTATAKVVKQIFAGSGRRRLKLVVDGSAFQIKVWEALLKLPEGSVVSYGDLARLAGSPNASRAVGTAVGSNPIAFLIPCHRVIRETGAFGQYRWGSVQKRAVLGWEHARKDAENADEEI